MIVLRTEPDETESTLEFLKDLRETMEIDPKIAAELVDRAIKLLTKKLEGSREVWRRGFCGF